MSILGPWLSFKLLSSSFLVVLVAIYPHHWAAVVPFCLIGTARTSTVVSPRTDSCCSTLSPPPGGILASSSCPSHQPQPRPRRQTRGDVVFTLLPLTPPLILDCLAGQRGHPSSSLILSRQTNRSSNPSSATSTSRLKSRAERGGACEAIGIYHFNCARLSAFLHPSSSPSVPHHPLSRPPFITPSSAPINSLLDLDSSSQTTDDLGR